VYATAILQMCNHEFHESVAVIRLQAYLSASLFSPEV